MLSLMKPSSRDNIYLMIGFSSRKNMQRDLERDILVSSYCKGGEIGGLSLGEAVTAGLWGRLAATAAGRGVPRHSWAPPTPVMLCRQLNCSSCLNICVRRAPTTVPFLLFTIRGPAALQPVQWQMVKPTGRKAWPHMSPYQPRWERAQFSLHLQYFKKQHQTQTVSPIDHLHYFIISLISSRMSDG